MLSLVTDQKRFVKNLSDLPRACFPSLLNLPFIVASPIRLRSAPARLAPANNYKFMKEKPRVERFLATMIQRAVHPSCEPKKNFARLSKPDIFTPKRIWENEVPASRDPKFFRFFWMRPDIIGYAE
jgi:hypothetical protein